MKADSRFIQYSYMYSTYTPLEGFRISLCALFWHFVGATIINGLVLGIFGFLLTMIGLGIYEHPWQVALGLSILMAGLGTIVAIIWASVTVLNLQDNPNSIVGAALRGIKEKYCPIITLK